MTSPFKPEGYISVSPYLITASAGRVIEFLTRVFNATALRRFDMPDGTIAHAEVKIDDSVVMLGEAGGDWPAAPCHIHVYVADVDATYRRALAAGGVSVKEPTQRGEDDPDRRGGVKDPGGNTWWIGTQVG